MDKRFYRTGYILVHFLTLALLFQLVARPVAADPIVYEPTSMPVEPVPVQMAFQPPPDASELSDFAPPGAVWIEVALPDVPITPTATAAASPSAEPPGTVTPGPTTSAEPSATSPAGQTPTPEPPATATPGVTPTSDLPIPTPGAPITPSVLTATVALNGAITNVVSFNGGEVGVIIEANTFSPAAELQFTAIPVPAPPITFTNTLSNPAQALPLVRFELEIVENGAPVGQFSKPVRLVVDLRSMTEGLNPVYEGNFYLAYRNATEPTLWHDVPIQLYQPDGLISAELRHFSDWAGGTRPSYWTPTFTPPAVDEFSGAATYSHPFAMPPGRNGLQPSVILSYSSRGLDGRIHDADSGMVADGWSLAEIAISRKDYKLDDVNGSTEPPVLVHPDKFSLVLNGTGYDLYPEDATTEPEVRYYAKDAPGLYIRRYYHSGLATDGLYWVVITPGGTLYRLGYTADSEEWQSAPAGLLQVSGHQGDANNLSATTWNVDTVTDPFGNQMTYSYFTRSLEANVEWTDSQGYGHSYLMTTRISRIDTFAYNYPDRVTTLPPSHATARLTSTPATRIQFRALLETGWHHETDPIQHIYVYHNSGSTPIKEYRINSHVELVDAEGCINEDPDPDVPRGSHTRVVSAIQEFVGVDSDPLSDDGWGLPATTFSYTTQAHFHNQHRDYLPCFSFRYLSEVHNGYGGRTSFSYSSDGRSIGEYKLIVYGVYRWPEIGYNYFVTAATSNDGRNPATVTEYAYTAPCYGQWSAEVGAMPGAVTCGDTDAPEYGNIVGFATTSRTNKGFNGEIVNRSISSFSQNTVLALGRPTQVDWGRVDAPDNFVVLNRTGHEYSTSPFGTAPAFAYIWRSTTTHYQNGIGSNTMSSKVEYAYDPAFQGGAQYGNLTHSYEFDDAADTTPFRTTVRRYFPNVSNGYWNVNRLASENVHPNADMTTVLAGSWSYYDNNTTQSASPTKGALTRSRALLPIGCGDVPGGGGTGCYHARQTVDTTHAYDVYGNKTTTTSYSDYGYRTFDVNWSPLVDIAPSQARSTTITYETGQYLYPVRVRNALLQDTYFEVYGFRNFSGALVPLSGFQKQPGLLKSVTEINGATTSYEYDVFGRLHAVYDGYSLAGFGDNNPWNGDPVTWYRYWDNSWNNPTTYLDPAGHAPFVVTVQQRPGSYPQPANSSSGYAFNEQTFYDGFGRPIQQRSVWNTVEGQALTREIIASTAYNAQGQVVCQSASYDVPFYSDRGKTWPQSPFVNEACTTKPRTSSTYDPLGRVDVVTAPDGTMTNHDYTIRNDITAGYSESKLLETTVTDANNHRLGHFTNALGQLLLVREYSGANPYSAYADTRYLYDKLGQLLIVTTSEPSSVNPSSWLRQTLISHDGLGRKTGMVDPDMGEWEYEYDAAGNLTFQTDAISFVCFNYDVLNRVTSKRTGGGCATTLASYLYHSSGGGAGRLAEIRWSSSSTQNRETMSYDSLGRLTGHTRMVDNRSYSLSYSNFDALHRPTTVTYPNGQTATYGFDHEGENSLANGGATLVSQVRYNGRRQMTSLDRVSVADTNYFYYGATDGPGGGAGDSNFRLQTIEHDFGSTWPDFTHEYDRVGNITKLTTASSAGTDVQSFSYDHLDRLVTAGATGGVANYSHSYSYNKLGNIQSFNGASYTYHATKKHAVTAIGANYSFGYDANGNMISRVDGTGSFTQAFNIENELASVTNINEENSVTTFAYDAAGIRVKTVEPNGTITDYPFPGYEVENPGLSSQTVRLTLSLAGQAIAVRVMTNSSNSLYYLFNDHLGSTTAIADGGGNLVAGSRAYYAPFGAYRGTAPTQTVTERGYTGHLHNNMGGNDLGLIYMRARYYAPGIGRFVSADTIVPDAADPQSYNRYSYALNDPVKNVDPSGHRTCSAQQAATGDETCDQNIPPEQEPAWQPTLVPGVTRVTVPIEFLQYWGITDDFVTIPIHTDPYNAQLFDWEVAANALYSEESTLHPRQSYYRNLHPDWLPFLEKYWVGDSIGIVQTMVNSEGNLADVVQSGKYTYVVHSPDDPNYLQFLAIAYAVIKLGEIPDLVNGYAYFSHQDTDPSVRGQGTHLNDTCCTDRAAFGPNPFDLKTWYVFPPLEVDCATTGC